MKTTKTKTKTTTRYAAQLTWRQGEDNQRVTEIVVRKITSTPNEHQGTTGTSTVVRRFSNLDVRGNQVPAFLLGNGWDPRGEWPTKPPYTKPYAVTVVRSDSAAPHEHTAKCGLIEWCPEIPTVSANLPQPTPDTKSTEGDSSAAGEDDETVITTLYTHLDATQASLERAERRAEQLRRERLTLARALVDEGESIATVAARLGVSKQYLHKKLTEAQQEQKEPTDPMF